MTIRILSVFILLISISASAPALASSFVSGSWRGQSADDKSGKFALCYMYATYKSGIMLKFVITRKLGWGLQLSKPSWKNLRKGGKTDVTLVVDDHRPMFATGTVTGKNTVTIPLTKVNRSLSLLRRGRVLKINTPKGSARFTLAGTYEGISRLSKCVTNKLLAETRLGTSNPFASVAAPAGKRNPFRIDRATATIAVSNLLSKAGITGFTILPPSKHVLKDQDVMWVQKNGVLGMFAAIKNAQNIGVDDMLAGVIGEEAKQCTGKFVSGKKENADSRDGISVRRIFVMCQNKASGYESHYTFIKTSDGLLMRIGFWIDGTSDADQPRPDQLERSDSVFTQNADWKSFR